MAKFFTGCTHFGHESIIKLADRPFSSVQEMDEVLIQNWNKVVRPKDEVFHLGDFSFKDKGYDILSRLNGKKTLLQGNHDPRGWGQTYLEVKERKTLICLMHYPIEEWNQWYRSSMMLHCHTHKKEFRSAERRYNVGVDSCGYKPISLEEIFDTFFDKEKR